jgi:hypothetical protein
MHILCTRDANLCRRPGWPGYACIRSRWVVLNCVQGRHLANIVAQKPRWTRGLAAAVTELPRLPVHVTKVTFRRMTTEEHSPREENIYHNVAAESGHAMALGYTFHFSVAVRAGRDESPVRGRPSFVVNLLPHGHRLRSRSGNCERIDLQNCEAQEDSHAPCTSQRCSVLYGELLFSVCTV